MSTMHALDPKTPGPTRTPRRRAQRARAGLAVLLTSAAITAAAPPAQAQTIPILDETHTLTIHVIDHNGKAPCVGCAGWIDIFQDTYDLENRKGKREYNIPYTRQITGTATEEVPTGTYTLITYLDDTADPADRTRLTYMVEVEVPVSGPTTVTLDAREAVLMEQPEVPEPDVQVRDHSFTLAKQYPQGDWSTYGDPSLCGCNHTDGYAHTDLYFTPFPAATLTKLVLADRWMLAEPKALKPGPYDPEGQKLVYSEAPTYAYHLAFPYTDGFDPGPRVFDAGEFVTVPVDYHADHDAALIATRNHITAPYDGSSGAEVVLFKPGEVATHYLASDEVIWRTTDWIQRTDGDQPIGLFRLQAFDAFPADEAGTVRPAQDRYSGPLHYAPTDTDGAYIDQYASGLFHAEMAPYVPVNTVRGGEDGDQFLPARCTVDNVPHLIRADGFTCHSGGATWRMWNTGTGTELDRGSQNVFTGMADGPATYRLEQRTDLDAFAEQYGHLFQTQPPAYTAWEFTSAPAAAEIPWYYTEGCGPLGGTACQVQPLLQLRYDLDLDSYNRASAGAAHTFTVEAYHHNDAADDPRVKTMTVEASFDDGQTWQTVNTKPLRQQSKGGGPGVYQVTVDHPALDQTGGFVGLRVTATDASGGTIEQVHNRAYMLK